MVTIVIRSFLLDFVNSHQTRLRTTGFPLTCVHSRYHRKPTLTSSRLHQARLRIPLLTPQKPQFHQFPFEPSQAAYHRGPTLNPLCCLVSCAYFHLCLLTRQVHRGTILRGPPSSTSGRTGRNTCRLKIFIFLQIHRRKQYSEPNTINSLVSGHPRI